MLALIHVYWVSHVVPFLHHRWLEDAGDWHGAGEPGSSSGQCHCRVVAAAAVELPCLGALWGQHVEGSGVWLWHGVLFFVSMGAVVSGYAPRC